MKVLRFFTVATLTLVTLSGARAIEPTVHQNMEEILVTAKYPKHLLLEEILAVAPSMEIVVSAKPPVLEVPEAAVAATGVEPQIVEEILVTAKRDAQRGVVRRPLRFF